MSPQGVGDFPQQIGGITPFAVPMISTTVAVMTETELIRRRTRCFFAAKKEKFAARLSRAVGDGKRLLDHLTGCGGCPVAVTPAAGCVLSASHQLTNEQPTEMKK